MPPLAPDPPRAALLQEQRWLAENGHFEPNRTQFSTAAGEVRPLPLLPLPSLGARTVWSVP